MAPKTDGIPTKATGLHPLLTQFEGQVDVVDPFKTAQGAIDVEKPYLCYVYRLEPRSYTGSPEWLKNFDQVPSYEILKNMFGGGKFQLKIYQDGAFQRGGGNICIHGSPKQPVEENGVSDDETPAVPKTAEGVLFGILSRKIEALGDKIAQLSQSAGAGVNENDPLNPSRLAQLMDVAQSKRLQAQMLNQMLVSESPATQPAPSGASSSDNLDLLLRAFQAGVEYAGDSSDSSGDDLVSKGLSSVLGMISKAMTKSPAVPGPTPAATVVPSEVALTPEQIEADRKDVEKVVAERKAVSMMDKLQRAISIMLDAMTGDVQYDIDGICQLVRGVLSQKEIDQVGDNLTFANVRALMEGAPEAQIELDSNKDDVEAVLLRLKGSRVDNVSESNGRD